MSLSEQKQKVAKARVGRPNIAMAAVYIVVGLAVLGFFRLVYVLLEVFGALVVLVGAGAIGVAIVKLYSTSFVSIGAWILLVVAIAVLALFYKLHQDREDRFWSKVFDFCAPIERRLVCSLGWMPRPDVRLVRVEQWHLEEFFHQMQHKPSQHMAAFVHKDPSNRTAFDAHWMKLLGSDRIIKRTVIVDSEIAGSILSFDMDDDREITYWIGHEYWGKGVATEALRRFLKIESKRPLFGRAAKDNGASIAVMENNGFRLISQGRGYANARGQEIDEVVMVLRGD